MEALDNIEIQPKKKRPFFLSLLCVLSFIYSGVLALVIVGLIWFVGSSITSEGVIPTFLVTIAVWLLNLIAVIQMWKLKKRGFYLYVLTNIIVTALQIYLAQDYTWMTFFWPILFIGLFATQFKSLS